jgi:hypothetical protein
VFVISPSASASSGASFALQDVFDARALHSREPAILLPWLARVNSLQEPELGAGYARGLFSSEN